MKNYTKELNFKKSNLKKN